MADSMIHPERLHGFLEYVGETGKLFWRPRPRDIFSTGHAMNVWNARYAGREAFTAQNNYGYKQGRIFRKAYLAHRVVWAMSKGFWPQGDIDHADMDKGNNRIDNLRLATKSQNGMNKVAQSNSASGVRGVYWNKRMGKWYSQVTVGGRDFHLGHFDRLDDASIARDEAAMRHHGDFYRQAALRDG